MSGNYNQIVENAKTSRIEQGHQSVFQSNQVYQAIRHLQIAKRELQRVVNNLPNSHWSPSISCQVDIISESVEELKTLEANIISERPTNST